MARFYAHWLRQAGRSDPAAALRAAQLEYLLPGRDGQASKLVWAQFVLIGG